MLHLFHGMYQMCLKGKNYFFSLLKDYMKIKTLIVFVVCFLSIHFVGAQSLIDCGISYYYDAAGNRILRLVPRCAPEHGKSDTTQRNTTATLTDSSTLATFQIVMINPNPTAGPFNITCNQNLTNAGVTVLDINGQILSQTIANGTFIQMDISRLVPGTYTVVVTSNGTPTSKQLIKMGGY